jgi:2'-5' RNA ligase
MPVRPSAVDDDLVTIGVLVKIPDPFGEELQRWRADFGDPMARAIPAHVTLLPPTRVAPGDAAPIGDHLAAVAAATAPFAVRLHGTDSFRPVSPVVYVRLADGTEGCDALQRRIRTGPLARELEFPYRPHVTVAHHLSERALDRAQLTLANWGTEFTVGEFGLYQHGRDSAWRVRRRFPLGG